jgi:hypothetical protein
LFLQAKGMDSNAKSISGTCMQIAVQLMNESKIRVFLKYGGDLNALDCYDRSSGDWILLFEPLSGALSPLMTSYKPKPAKEARDCLLEYMKERIDLILAQKEDDKTVYTRRLGNNFSSSTMTVPPALSLASISGTRGENPGHCIGTSPAQTVALIPTHVVTSARAVQI